MSTATVVDARGVAVSGRVALPTPGPATPSAGGCHSPRLPAEGALRALLCLLPGPAPVDAIAVALGRGRP